MWFIGGSFCRDLSCLDKLIRVWEKLHNSPAPGLAQAVRYHRHYQMAFWDLIVIVAAVLMFWLGEKG
jgi:hypothetical protein